jgi:phosphate-selective porin OprO and OprP
MRLRHYFILGIGLFLFSTLGWTAKDRFNLNTNGLVQPWVSFLAVDGGTNATTFRVRRARVDFTGNVFNSDVQFRLQPEFTGSAGGATATLLDAYVDWTGWKHFQIKFGQFKPAYSREYLTSASNLQFVDRSIVNGTYFLNYDLGVAFHGLFGGGFDYTLYAINADGANQINKNKDFALGGRFTWAVLGNHGLTYSDVGHSAKSKFDIGIAGAYDMAAAGFSGNKIMRATADMVYAIKGFSMGLEGHYVSNTTTSQNDLGVVGQLGYFFLPQKFEVAVRGATIATDTTGAFGTGPVDSTEITGAFNYFFNGHALKLQGDVGYLLNNGGKNGQDDIQVRMQLTAAL